MTAVPELSRSVQGLAVLVTGAGSGMGRATAVVFARQGARVAVTDIDGAAAQAVAREIAAEGGEAQAWRLDVARPDDIGDCVLGIGEAFGGVDIVVNNAGVARFARLDDPGYDDNWHRHLDILLSAHQRIVRAVLPMLRRSVCARIVNIASTEAFAATAGNSAYSAAKAGVIGLTRALAVELGPEGITVNCICPGPILTGMTDAIDEEARRVYARRRTALRRYGEPAEVAHMVLSLCLPAAAYTTGSVLLVDGGLQARNA
ncbi:MAG: 3-oxoacyl-[ACP] reductase [Hydrocarboniphaga sp.]|uniref:SDR family NAD(P)-dependent oxidoreductase n=1 Tax=Hydrocarboniphaga sp. TaxID=2033016 RepID=UPI002609DCC1|nr:SDR family NAD(P)-dependent oxidoreductase [Hydrocarboniphaga sp.]MDB5969972.1 3-oxoacyl-[ACP] reductase [Hydrocarboniphaga sp.]